MNGNYPNNAGGGLLSPPICVTPSSYVLVIDHYVQTERTSPGDPDSTEDGCNVTVNGSVIMPCGSDYFGVISTTDKYDPNCVDSEPGFFGGNQYPGFWMEHSFLLSDYMDQTIQVRFDFGSDELNTFPGWRIGRVRVRGTAPSASEASVLGQCMVPTPITWTGGAGDGSWHSASNWDLARVPGAGDVVSIPDLVGTTSVIFSSASTSINSLTCAEVLNVTGGALDNAAASSIATLNLSGGQLTGTGNVTVTTAFNWTAGQLKGTRTFTIPGGLLNTDLGLTIDGPVTLVNNGTCTLTGSGSVNPSNGGVFRNASGATFDIQGDAGIGGGDGRFENQDGAVFKRSTGSGLCLINGFFINDGLLVLQSGTLRFNQNNNTNRGQIASNPGTTLEFYGGFTFLAGSLLDASGMVTFRAGTIDAGASFTPGGVVNLEGTTGVTFNAPCTIPTLNINYFAPAHVLGSGDLTVTIALNWTLGLISGTRTLTTAAGSMCSVNAANNPTLNGPAVLNDGTWTLTGNGNLALSNSSIFRNRSGGTFDIQSDAGLTADALVLPIVVER